MQSHVIACMCKSSAHVYVCMLKAYPMTFPVEHVHRLCTEEQPVVPRLHICTAKNVIATVRAFRLHLQTSSCRTHVFMLCISSVGTHVQCACECRNIT